MNPSNREIVLRDRDLNIKESNINVFNNNKNNNNKFVSGNLLLGGAIKRPAPENRLKIFEDENLDDYKDQKFDGPGAKKCAFEDLNNTSLIPKLSSFMTIDSSKKQHQNFSKISVTVHFFFNCILLVKKIGKFNTTETAQNEKIATRPFILSIDESASAKMFQISTSTQAKLISDDFKLQFDRDNANDLSAVSDYVHDIFQYYKHREHLFKVGNYFLKHSVVTQDIRAQLIDWFVNLQESFEFNHETLYLAVKLFDIYMDRSPTKIRVNQIRIVGAAAMFIASKFDELSPPLLDDFLYFIKLDNNKHADVTQDHVLRMERIMLNLIGFDIGAPLSYRFLRRYSRIAQVEMHTLTLARYILEVSLMYLNFCRVSESLLAAASLSLAFRMKKIGYWTPLLREYSGYSQADIEDLVMSLNHMVILTKRNKKYETVLNKYSHEIFFGVAHTKSLPDLLNDRCIDLSSHLVNKYK